MVILSAAIVRASIIRLVRKWSAIAYPTTCLVWQSRTVAKYSHPSHVRTYVMSPTSLVAGVSQVKSRATRSGVSEASPATVVVGRQGRGWHATRPSSRMSQPDRLRVGMVTEPGEVGVDPAVAVRAVRV